MLERKSRQAPSLCTLGKTLLNDYDLIVGEIGEDRGKKDGEGKEREK